MAVRIKTVLMALLCISCTACAQGRRAAAQDSVLVVADDRAQGNVPAKAKNTADPLTSTAADRRSVEVTVYNGNLGLVKEQRRIRAAAGEGELRFSDVAAQINPVTVHIKPLSDAKDFAVLEQNYEYDLISHAKLMDKYVGKEIKIIDANEYQDRKDVVNATLLSVANGEVYKIGNEIYLGHPGIKVLPELPGNLISRPTLSWIYRSKAARDYNIEVSYLTYGMGWSADYVLSVADGKAAGGLSGWVTVNNQSGAEYAGARLKLVAGEVNRVPRPEPAYGMRRAKMEMAMSTMATDNAGFTESGMFEYHSYDLGRSVTIKENQTKQISLLEAQGVNIVKEYVTTPSMHNAFLYNSVNEGAVKQPVVAYLSFKNTKENNLAVPLPAGVIRIYTDDVKGSRQFIGEDRINHTPRDEEIRLKVGEAFDIVAERAQVDFAQKTSKVTETEWKISLRNRKEEDVTVRVQENASGQWEIVEPSHKFTKVSATQFRFDVPVPRGQEVAVKYKIRVKG
ncbi:MAG: DUF4139 domain-containing protein [Chitinispirillales bacterium]|jgi:hypothetical protein|nr:DUF4139 domain-containing protein [Chitinispirillales bacterium]